MADDLRVRGILEILLKGRGAKDAAADLKLTDKAAKDVERSLDRAERSAANFGSTLTRFVGGAVLISFAKNATTEFARFERQLGAISLQIDRLGGNSEEAVPRVRALVNELEGLGVGSTESAQAFQRFLGITEDFDAALLLTRVAAGASAKGMAEFGNAAAALGSIIQGEVLEPGKSLGLAVKDINGETKTGTELIREAIEQYGKFGGTLDDTQAKLDRVSGAWNRFKLGVGSAVASLLDFLSFGKRIEQAAVLLITPAIKFITERFGDLANVIKSFGTIDLLQLLTGNVAAATAGVQAAISQALDNISRGVATFQQQQEEAWRLAGERQGQAVGEGFEAGAAALQEIVGRAEDAAAKAAAEKARLRAEEEERQRAEFALKATESRLRAELALTEEGSEERLKIELEILELAKKRALENAEEIGAGEAEIREAFRLAELKLVADHEEAKGNIAAAALQARAESEFNAFVGRLQAEIAALDEADQLKLQKQLEFLDLQRAQELGGKELTEQQVADIEDKYRLLREEREAEHAERLKAISDSVAQANQQNAIESARVAIAAGRAFFGESKALAYAETIINTAAAAMRAYRQGGWWAAALAIATGAVQLATIRNTDIGGGSEPSISGSIPTAPGTDARRPDLNETQGWRADQPQGRTTTSGNTYVFQGPNIVNDSDMRRFMRKAREVERRDQARRQR